MGIRRYGAPSLSVNRLTLKTPSPKRSTVGVYCLPELDAGLKTRCLESTQNLNGLIVLREHSR